jgi:hypothetical protein
MTDLVYDVSRFAGQEVKLDFVGPFGLPNPMAPPLIVADAFVDTIQFLSEPYLTGSRSGTNLFLSWPASITGYVLQSTHALSATNV